MDWFINAAAVGGCCGNYKLDAFNVLWVKTSFAKPMLEEVVSNVFRPNRKQIFCAFTLNPYDKRNFFLRVCIRLTQRLA